MGLSTAGTAAREPMLQRMGLGWFVRCLVIYARGHRRSGLQV